MRLTRSRVETLVMRGCCYGIQRVDDPVGSISSDVTIPIKGYRRESWILKKRTSSTLMKATLITT